MEVPPTLCKQCGYVWDTVEQLTMHQNQPGVFFAEYPRSFGKYPLPIFMHWQLCKLTDQQLAESGITNEQREKVYQARVKEVCAARNCGPKDSEQGECNC